MDAFQQHPRDHHQEQVMQDNRKCLAYHLQGRDKNDATKKLKVVYQNQARGEDWWVGNSSIGEVRMET